MEAGANFQTLNHGKAVHAVAAPLGAEDVGTVAFGGAEAGLRVWDPRTPSGADLVGSQAVLRRTHPVAWFGLLLLSDFAGAEGGHGRRTLSERSSCSLVSQLICTSLLAISCVSCIRWACAEQTFQSSGYIPSPLRRWCGIRCRTQIGLQRWRGTRPRGTTWPAPPMTAPSSCGTCAPRCHCTRSPATPTRCLRLAVVPAIVVPYVGCCWVCCAADVLWPCQAIVMRDVANTPCVQARM